jgi:uncharacterized membrane protein YeaQ/YmgE (transglycosylase-associated protein family)
MLLGIVGAWLGGMIGRALHWYPPGHPSGFIMAVVGAVAVLVVYGFLTRSTRVEVRYGAPLEDTRRAAAIIRA